MVFIEKIDTYIKHVRSDSIDSPNLPTYVAKPPNGFAFNELPSSDAPQSIDTEPLQGIPVSSFIDAGDATDVDDDPWETTDCTKPPAQ